MAAGMCWSAATDVTTDNAYVGADTAQITPMVAGQVLDVPVSDTRVVHRGDVLVRIDDRDARIALARAEAELARASASSARPAPPARRSPRR